MPKLEGFDWFATTFDADGRLAQPGELDALVAHVGTGVTDVVFLAHGFRNDEADALGLYTGFLNTFRAHLSRAELAALAARRFAVVGVFWPSKRFSEDSGAGGGGAAAVGGAAAERARVKARLETLAAESTKSAHKQALTSAIGLLDRAETDTKAQDDLVRALLTLVADVKADDGDGLDRVRARPGHEVLARFSAPILLPTHKKVGDGGVAGVGGGAGGVLSIGGLFHSIAGKVGQFLNVTTWWTMKERSGVVGAAGLAPAVRRLRAKQPALKIHLVGHSLGGRLVTACAKALSAPKPVVAVDSLSLLEAAFSHYGFAPDNGEGRPGFFREVITERVVTGPTIATFSAKDTVVGTVYALASRLADDNVKAVGDAGDKFGGIGRNGAQRTPESTSAGLHKAGAAYGAFAAGKVNCLDGSQNLINDHGDVRNEHVTYAVASAIAQT